MTYVPVSPVVVGRARQVSEIRDALTTVAGSEDGRVVLLAAPAGMGKSRLVAESLAMAASMGLGRLEGGCTPDAGVPYAPFVAALRRRTRSMDDDELQTLFSGPARWASVLLPEVAELLGVDTAPRSAEDLSAALWRVLRRLSRPSGLVFVLEDLHWADEGTLRLLTYLARETTGLPVCFLGTYRSDEVARRHPLAPVVSELVRERRADRLELAPLALADVRDLVGAILDGTQVSGEFADLLLQRTGGNPFFIEELLKVLVDRGDVYRTADDWERREISEIALPASVRDTLLTAAGTMDPTSVLVLQSASVAGIELDLELLARVCEVDTDAVDHAVVEGLERHILTVLDEGGVERYAFRHALSREAFSDELIGPRRRSTHRRIGDALIALHPDDLDTVAAAIAEHLAAGGDADRAADFAVRAAVFAKGRADDTETDRLYDLALRLLSDSDPRRGAVLLAAADPDLSHMTDLRRAFAEELLRTSSAAGDHLGQARALHTLAVHSWYDGRGSMAVQQLEQALQALAGMDAPFTAPIHARYTRVLALSDQLRVGDPRLDESEEIARRYGDDAALSGVLNTRMLIEGDDAVAAVLYEQARESARRARAFDAEAQVDINYGYVSLWRGRFEASEKAFRRGIAYYEVAAPADLYPQAGLAWVLSLRGMYVEAEQLAMRARGSRRPPERSVALTALAEIATRQARADAGEIVQELFAVGMTMDESQRSVPALSARARHLLMTEGVDAAEPVFEQAASSTAAHAAGSHWPFSPDLAQALATEGRTAQLQRWAERTSAITAHDPNPHNLAADMLVRAHLLRLVASPEEAAAAFAEAHDRYAAMTCPARQVEALVGLGRTRAAVGDATGARRALEDASDHAERLDAQQLRTLIDEARGSALARPVLATLLFTDIVGSTESAVSLGDRAWNERLARHHAIVRRELVRAGGRELDTAGDGFMVAFDSPTAGVRCALDVQRALAEAGIPIRAGLHTGECHEYDGKLTGLAVHVAARVSQLATAGEVLVSTTVRDLVAGSDLEVVDRGQHELKGLPGSWGVFSVRRRT